MNGTTETEGIVEQSLQRILKKTGMGGVIFFVALGGILVLAASGSVIFSVMGVLPFTFGDLGMVFLFLIMGALFLVFGIYRYKKRGKMKNDLYGSLIVCGTTQEARTVAEEFNREYLSAAHDPVLEKAGLIITKSYIMARGRDVGIVPRDAVFFVFQQGQPKNSANDDTTILIYCRYTPGLKAHDLPGIRVFGKPGMALVQAVRALGYPILPFNPTTDMKLVALAQENYQNFEHAIRERFGQ